LSEFILGIELKLAISFARRYLIRLNYEAREKCTSLIWIHSNHRFTSFHNSYDTLSFFFGVQIGKF
jgi:hypothetical protein